MFGWFKKQPEQPKPGETEAYQMGQQASQAMTAAVDDYMTARFEPVFKIILAFSATVSIESMGITRLR